MTTKPGSGFTNRSIKIMRGTATSLDRRSSAAFSSIQNDKYPAYDELEPLINPEMEWNNCLQDIKVDQWNVQVDACNIIRRACKFHTSELIIAEKKNPKEQH